MSSAFRAVCGLVFPLRLVTQRYSAGASREIQKLGQERSFLKFQMGELLVSDSTEPATHSPNC
jgi:hypothetical protein